MSIPVMLFALLLLLSPLLMAAKPDPDKVPEVMRCNTLEEIIAIRDAEVEPLCLFDSTDNIVVFYPLLTEENFDHYSRSVNIYNSSFESTEVCDGGGLLSDRLWRVGGDALSRGFTLHNYLPEHCEPGTFFLITTHEYDDPDDDENDWRDTYSRRWVIEED